MLLCNFCKCICRQESNLRDTISFSGSVPVLRTLDIRFERGDKGLGLSIAGGLGSTPYKPNDEGIFISRVTPGGPAAIAGLAKDDKV